MTNIIAEYYLESHITIEPVFDERLEQIKVIAEKFGFKVADLLMQKRKEDSEERSKSDTFMTSHAKDLNNISLRTQACIMALKADGFKVWRYKIENIVYDSKIKDIYGILDEETYLIKRWESVLQSKENTANIIESKERKL